jgi:hypothetical protein
MKKQLLLLSAMLIFSLSFAQSFKLYFEGQALLPDAEITLLAHPDSGLMLLDTLDVKNISDVTSEVYCVRTMVEDVEGTNNSFCWGSCYPPAIDTSTITVTIMAKATSNEFVGDHYPNGVSGVVKVKYTFYDSHNEGNQTSVFVNYDATSSNGINEKASQYTMSEVYPNPANQIATIDYDFTGFNNSSIVIYNLLGTVVEKLDVSDKSGKAKINTSLYQEGIYFYSLLFDNEVIRTQKLIVRH